MTTVRRLALGALAMVPFLLLLLAHWVLGLSDAFLAAPRPGERFWPLYNPIMVLSFYLGLGAWFWVGVRGLGPDRPAGPSRPSARPSDPASPRP